MELITKHLDSREKYVPGYSYKLAVNQYALDSVVSDRFYVDETRMAAYIPFASGERRDGVGDLLEVGGIETDRHRANPIVLFDHGKQVTLPIAMAEDPQSKSYTVELDPSTKTGGALGFFYGSKSGDGAVNYEHALFCEQIFDMMAKRFIRGGSIGYTVIDARELPPDYRYGIPAGLHLLRTKMLELSAVILPANQDTVNKGFDYWMQAKKDTARRILSMPKICGKGISPYLVKSLMGIAGQKRVSLYTGQQGQKANYAEGVLTQELDSEGRVTFQGNRKYPVTEREDGGRHVDIQYGDRRNRRSGTRVEDTNRDLADNTGQKANYVENVPEFTAQGVTTSKRPAKEPRHRPATANELGGRNQDDFAQINHGIRDNANRSHGDYVQQKSEDEGGEKRPIHIEKLRHQTEDQPVEGVYMDKVDRELHRHGQGNRLRRPSYYGHRVQAREAGADQPYQDSPATSQQDADDLASSRAERLRSRGHHVTESEREIKSEQRYSNPLSNSQVPPARFKPGVGAIKEIRAKYRKKSSDDEYTEVEVVNKKPLRDQAGEHLDKVDRELRNAEKPVRNRSPQSEAQANVRRGGQLQSQVYGTEEDVRNRAIEITGSRRNRGETVYTGERTQDKAIKPKFKDIRKKYRSTKSVRRTLKKSSPGASVMYVDRKSVDALREQASAKSVQLKWMAEDGNTVKVKMSGDDGAMDALASDFGLPAPVKGMQTKAMNTKKLGDNPPRTRIASRPENNKQGRQEYEGAVRWHLGEQYADPKWDEQETEEPEVEGEDKSMKDDQHAPSTEPYGAQILRRMHEDHSRLLGDYDSLLGPLEHDGVRNHLTGHCAGIEKSLTDIEKLWGKNYKELPPLVEEMEEGGEEDGESWQEEPGTEAVEQQLDDEQVDELASPEDDHYMEDEEGESLQELEEDVDDREGSELDDGKDMDTIDDAAIPASSGSELEETPPEEAWCASQMQSQSKSKDIRQKYKMIDRILKNLCPGCGGKECKCGTKGIGIRTKAGDKVRQELRAAGPHAESNYDQDKQEARQRTERAKERPSGQRTRTPTFDDPEQKAQYVHTDSAGNKHPKIDYESEPDPAYAAEMREESRQDSTRMAAERAAADARRSKTKSMSGGWDDRERGSVTEAADFLGQIGQEESIFDEECRMKSYHYHKTFDGIAAFSAGTKFIDPGYSAEGEKLSTHRQLNREASGGPSSRDTGTSFVSSPEGGIEFMTGPKNPSLPKKKPAENMPGPADAGYPSSKNQKKLHPEIGDEHHKDIDDKSIPGDPNWVQEELAEEEHQMHPHRKMCKDCSGFFRKLAGERAFGDPHRREALDWHTKIKAILEEGLEEDELSEDEIPGVEMEQTWDEDETEMDEMGEVKNSEDGEEVDDRTPDDRTPEQQVWDEQQNAMHRYAGQDVTDRTAEVVPRPGKKPQKSLPKKVPQQGTKALETNLTVTLDEQQQQIAALQKTLDSLHGVLQR